MAPFIEVQPRILWNPKLRSIKTSTPQLCTEVRNHTRVGNHQQVPSSSFEFVRDRTHPAPEFITALPLRRVAGHPGKAKNPPPRENGHAEPPSPKLGELGLTQQRSRFDSIAK
jgi:hypothetical protein